MNEAMIKLLECNRKETIKFLTRFYKHIEIISKAMKIPRKDVIELVLKVADEHKDTLSNEELWRMFNKE